MVKTLFIHCRGHRFDLWIPDQGTKIPQAVWLSQECPQDQKNVAHTAVFKMDNQQGPILYSTENSAQCHVAA